jgi:hypothetical protein
MDLFGKGTKPCKDPRNPSKDASFYTIPVKLTFNNKQVSKHVNEILRQKYKVSTSIPYHRTLKPAITMAHEKVSKQNPGKQVLISLDAPKKALKPFTRSPPVGGNRSANSTWVSAGNPIPLPSDALNPKLKEVSEDFTLPTSPTMVSSPHQSLSVSGKQSGIIHTQLKMTPEVARQLEEQKRAEASKGKEDDSVFSTQEEGEKMDVADTSEKNDEPPSGPGPEY